MGADYNKADREATARLAERQRLEKFGPPIQKDPLGNAIIGGGVTRRRAWICRRGRPRDRHGHRDRRRHAEGLEAQRK